MTARELAFVARHCRIEFNWSTKPPGVLLNDEPVGHVLRGKDATAAASCVAVVPAIREQLVRQQQEIGQARGNLVTEGRDQGTVVFPERRSNFSSMPRPPSGRGGGRRSYGCAVRWSISRRRSAASSPVMSGTGIARSAPSNRQSMRRFWIQQHCHRRR